MVISFLPSILFLSVNMSNLNEDTSNIRLVHTCDANASAKDVHKSNANASRMRYARAVQYSKMVAVLPRYPCDSGGSHLGLHLIIYHFIAGAGVCICVARVNVGLTMVSP